jgi:undecaprenyl diphosphate synthase
MKLFLRMLDNEVEELHRRGARIVFIGERSEFSPVIQEKMARAEALTRGNSAITANIAAGYGGRWDIVNAARALAGEVAAGRLRPDQIDEALFAQGLALADQDPPDLFIRTGGDLRVSNFLLWQLAYTELWFTEVLWPDLDEATLRQALDDYANRERRFGLTSAQVAGVAP